MREGAACKNRGPGVCPGEGIQTAVESFIHLSIPPCCGHLLSVQLCAQHSALRGKKDEVVPSRCSGPGGDNRPRAPSLGWAWLPSGRKCKRLPSLGSRTCTRPQATPLCCLGSLALGQPCAEAVERDVPLAQGGVGHRARCQTVPLAPTTRHGGCWGVRLKGSLHECEKDWSGPQVPCPGALATSVPSAASSLCVPPLPIWHLFCGLAADSCLMRLFPQFPEKDGGQEEPFFHQAVPPPLPIAPVIHTHTRPEAVG